MQRPADREREREESVEGRDKHQGAHVGTGRESGALRAKVRPFWKQKLLVSLASLLPSIIAIRWVLLLLFFSLVGWVL